MPFVNQLEPPVLLQHFLQHPPVGFQARPLDHGVPAFEADFDLLTTAHPTLRAWVARLPLQRLWQRLLRPRTNFVGSTVTEYAWLPRAADPAQLPRQWRAQLGRRRALLIVKDVAQASPLLDAADNAWAQAFLDACQRSGYLLLRGQALAWVPIDFASTDEYLARLSRARRRNIRRKLRSRADLQVEVLSTGAAFADPALRAQCYALYQEVYAQSEVHFDLLTAEFFDALLTDSDSGGLMFVYRHDGLVIGWNLCYVHDGRLLDKYIGLHYPASHEHNLYALSWMENLDYACRHGLRAYVAGWTDPEVKAQLGASFTYTWHAVYLRNPLLRALLRLLRPLFEADDVGLSVGLAQEE
ncbi:GNAT family N-acetyltransferase [Xanthomonas albilineans]|uniref:GNAT family N-acetyltransferase n=1 Tax=Xanthomonas albilineans TaxID=29447 RepID=UPI0005F35DE1|nr:GNAT family N-acetyltransferase [Xanthomonas albilineans]PPU94579.1 GNAT family N-acetyltransferase [Xanthomonas albilineans]